MTYPTAYDYVNAQPYEHFLRRAYCNGSVRELNRASYHAMQNLIRAEHNDSCVSHLPPYEKQLVQVKACIEKGSDAFAHPKRNIKATHREQLRSIKIRLTTAETAAELVAILREALDITHDYKER